MTNVIEVHDAVANQIDTDRLYRILRLRSEVLVVEKQVPYLDLDGRDLFDSTFHIWAEAAGDVVGTVRLISDGDVMRMGRLCTAYQARGHGVARKLLTRAIEIAGNVTIDTNTQTHLAPWHEKFGFVATGPIFHEVGIPHTPMRRSAGATVAD